MKQLSGRNLCPSTHTINKADGFPCETEDDVLFRWREHCELALNHPGLLCQHYTGRRSLSCCCRLVRLSRRADVRSHQNYQPSPSYIMVVLQAETILRRTAKICHRSNGQSCLVNTCMENGPCSFRLERQNTPNTVQRQR